MSSPPINQTAPYLEPNTRDSIPWWNRFKRIRQNWYSTTHLKLVHQDQSVCLFEQKSGWFSFYFILGISTVSAIFPLSFMFTMTIPFTRPNNTNILNILFVEIALGIMVLLCSGMELFFLDVTLREWFGFRSTKRLVLDRQSNLLTLELNPWLSPKITNKTSLNELKNGIKLESRDDGYKKQLMWYVLANTTLGEIIFLRSADRLEAEELSENFNLFLQGERVSVNLIQINCYKNKKFLWIRPSSSPIGNHEPWIVFKRGSTLKGTVLMILLISFFGFIFVELLVIEVGSWEAFILLALFLTVISLGVFILPFLAYIYFIFAIIYHEIRVNPQLEIWPSKQRIVLRNKVRFGKILADHDFTEIQHIEARFGINVIVVKFLLKDHLNLVNQAPLNFKLRKRYDQQVMTILNRLDPWIPTKTIRLMNEVVVTKI